jgi:hypothetical protein
MWGPLPSALNILIQIRCIGIRQRIYRLIERIQAGTYVPRRAGPRRAPTARRARPPGPLAYRFGWLEPLLPEIIQHRAQLDALLRDAEIAALIQAAPAAMVPPLRSLCWMLKLKPPPILARPRPAALPPPRPRSPEAAAPCRPPPLRPAPRPSAPSRPAQVRPRPQPRPA